METTNYPYSILTVKCLNPEELKKVDLWSIQEFFRIEFLLRSKSVMSLYRTHGATPECSVLLLLEFGFPWTVLQGSHHDFLTLRPGQTRPIPGVSIFNFKGLYQSFMVLSKFLSTQTEEQKCQVLERFDQRFLALICDPTISPSLIQEAITPILEDRYQSVGQPAQRRPLRFDVPTWLKYLACYDLRLVEGRTYGEIAASVYAETGPNPRDRSEKAVARVSKMIAAAAQHQWPPSSS